LSANIFNFSIIGGKLKAEKHAVWPALRSTACGGASRRCAAPIAAARALRATPPGRYAPSALRAHPFYNMKKKPEEAVIS
jgi:hypothetical protein